jgi:hypothetical protein
MQTDGRTYHNTAVLLPDASVLVGGHAPIATAYAFQDDAGHDLLGLSKAESDPSFQIYRPPYLNWGIPQPQISSVTATSLAMGAPLGSPAHRQGPSCRLCSSATALSHIWWMEIGALSSYPSQVVPARASKWESQAQQSFLLARTCCSCSNRPRRGCYPPSPAKSSSTVRRLRNL